MRAIFRYTPILLGLPPVVAPPPSAAQISSTEVVYVHQTQVNDRPYFQIRRRAVTGTADSKMVGGCPTNLAAIYCVYADPVVSPDGKRLAFVFEPVGEIACKAIWIAGITGTGRQQISTGCADSRPAWSPDGSRIAFERDNTIYEVPLCRNTLPERSPRRVTAGTSPSYSRDGRWIAFARDGDIYKIQGTSEVNLTQTAVAEWEPRWTKRAAPTDLIVFLSGSSTASHLFTIDAAGQNRRQITPTASARYSPDMAILPSAFAWESGDNVVFQSGTSSRVVTPGRQPSFGGGTAKVRNCP